MGPHDLDAAAERPRGDGNRRLASIVGERQAVEAVADRRQLAQEPLATGPQDDRPPGVDEHVQAGQQFEAVFTGMMLKSMRQAKLSDPLFDSKALDTFRDMQDQATVRHMAEHTPVGIGKAMTDFLAKSQPNLNAGHGTQLE